jgi:glycerophosphoryl diester phosphodiesterase
MWNIAHRGASGDAPENTMAAFRLAVEIGARCIETDLRITKDGRVVAMHDSSLLRTAGLPRRVSSKTAKEIHQLSAGRWFAPRGRKFRRERVPSLQEILRFGGAKQVTLYLELKNLPERGLEEAVVAAIQSAKAKRRVVVISFHDAALRKVKELDPAIAIGLLDKEVPREVILRALAIGAAQILAKDDRLTPKLISEIRDGGLKVIAWTVNDPKRMRDLIRAGIDGIITDYPGRLEQVIAEIETLARRR